MERQLPTLKQHVALILALLRACHNKEFSNLYGLARMLISNNSLHNISDDDIRYFSTAYDNFDSMPKCKRHYHYDRSITSGIGPRTLRWFVETQLIPMIELHIKISISNTNNKDNKDINVTLESVENLL